MGLNIVTDSSFELEHTDRYSEPTAIDLLAKRFVILWKYSLVLINTVILCVRCQVYSLKP